MVLDSAPDGGQTLLPGPVVLLQQFDTDVATARLEGSHAGGATAGKRIEHNRAGMCEGLN